MRDRGAARSYVALGLPCPAYLRRIALRSAGMWLLVRLLLSLALWLSGLELSSAVLSPTWGIPALLVWLDRKSADEMLLPANLGGSELWISGVSLGIAVLLDLAAHLLLIQVLHLP